MELPVELTLQTHLNAQVRGQSGQRLLDLGGGAARRDRLVILLLVPPDTTIRRRRRCGRLFLLPVRSDYSCIA